MKSGTYLGQFLRVFLPTLLYVDHSLGHEHRAVDNNSSSALVLDFFFWKNSILLRCVNTTRY